MHMMGTHSWTSPLISSCMLNEIVPTCFSPIMKSDEKMRTCISSAYVCVYVNKHIRMCICRHVFLL